MLAGTSFLILSRLTKTNSSSLSCSSDLLRTWLECQKESKSGPSTSKATKAKCSCHSSSVISTV